MLNEEEAVSDAQSPMDYKYMKCIRIYMKILSSWTINEKAGKLWIFYKYYMISLTMLYMSLNFIFLFLHKNELSFYEVGHLYITSLMAVVSFSRCMLIFSKSFKEISNDFVKTFHLYFHRNESEYAMQTHIKVHQLSHFFTVYLSTQMGTGIVLFNVIPMVNNYTNGKYKSEGLGNGTFEHSIYLAFPFDVARDIKGYCFANIFNWYISYTCSSSICFYDLYLCVMVFHSWGHFKILLNKLYTFPRPAAETGPVSAEINSAMYNSEMFSDSESVLTAKKLKECINYHTSIVAFVNKMSETFGFMLFVYYIFHQACLCLLLLECSAMTAQALMRYGPLTIILFQQLIQISVVFELIGSVTDRLADAVYSVPWECMDTKNRRTVLIFLKNVQEPIHMKALGVANVGVNSMTAILKTTFSYFAFLRTIE